MKSYSRRDFLKVLGASAVFASSIPLSACSSDTGADGVQTESSGNSASDSSSAYVLDGGPSELFNKPGRHIWFYGSSPSKDAHPELFVFEDGKVSTIRFENLSDKPNRPKLGDLEGLTDDEIIALYEECYTNAYDNYLDGRDVNVIYNFPDGYSSNRRFGPENPEKLTLVNQDSLIFPAIPVDLTAKTDSTGNNTVSESFQYEELCARVYCHNDVTQDTYNNSSEALDVDIRLETDEETMRLGSPFGKPYEVYSTVYGGFEVPATGTKDPEYFYTRLIDGEYDIHLDQPGTEGVTFD